MANFDFDQWGAFPGGELEGVRPPVRCPRCRDGQVPSAVAGSQHPLCFLCYRLAFERDRRLAAAAGLNTGSSDRFQELLPFEPVNRARLQMLKAARQAARPLPATVRRRR